MAKMLAEVKQHVIFLHQSDSNRIHRRRKNIVEGAAEDSPDALARERRLKINTLQGFRKGLMFYGVQITRIITFFTRICRKLGVGGFRPCIDEEAKKIEANLFNEGEI